jgi:metal-responsive CopG/Arc/MetJ family transcriptional regulator
MTKVNISLPAELLERIDAEAKQLGMSRSGLIQEASAHYIASTETEREAEIRRMRIDAAMKRMKKIGKEMGLVGHIDTVKLVHDAREEDERNRGY